jgi:hypothetical protein
MVKSQRLAAACAIGLVLLVVLPFAGAAEEALPIGPGATYQSMYRPEGPWAIHIVEAELAEEYLSLRSLLGGGTTMARGQLSMVLGAAGSDLARPVAGVNGDFFSLAGGSYRGLPLGLHIGDGELMSFPDPARSVFYLLDDGTLHIDRLRANAWVHGPGGLLFPLAGMNRPPGFADLVLFTPRFGEYTRSEEPATQVSLIGLSDVPHANADVSARIASISTGASQRIPPGGAVLVARGVAAYALRKLTVGDGVTLSLDLLPERGRITQAVGGGPRLVRNGVVSVEHERERFSGSFARKRHPRTGLGLRGSTLVMVVVDGRQPGYSEGMTLYEFADLFLELGCSDAINLDGGGSTTIVARDRLMNSPSGGYQRAVVNALGLLTTSPIGPPVRLALEPRTVTVLSGEQVALRPLALDSYYNPVSVDPSDVSWHVPAMLGLVDEAGLFTAADLHVSTMSHVRARFGDLSASTIVRVAPAPARVVVTPPRVALLPGDSQQFRARAYDSEGQPMRLSPARLHWRMTPQHDDGELSDTGLLRAPTRGGKMFVVACVGDVCGTAEVTVATRLAVLEDFERAGTWSYQSQPPGLPVSVRRVPDPLRPDNQCLRLGYDFTKGEGTRTAHAVIGLPLPETGSFSMRVWGDGGGCWLRARLRDGAGRGFTVDLAHRVTWSSTWREVDAPLPSEAEAPITLESVYLAEYHEDRRPVGAVYFDDICAGPGRSEERR